MDQTAQEQDFQAREHLAALLFLGQHEFKWDDLGQEVVYTLYPTGDEERIQRQISGLDYDAKQYVRNIFELANGLRSVGGYDFQNSLEEKLKFVRGLHKPVFNLFLKKFLEAQLQQEIQVKEYIEKLGKSKPTLSSEPSGDS